MRHNDETAQQAFVQRGDKNAATVRGVAALGLLAATVATGGWAGVAMIAGGGLALRSMERASAVDLGSVFSREEELEADRLGLQLAAQAGYNPGVAIPFMQAVATAADSRERSIGEAVDRRREQQLPASLEWVMRTSASTGLVGKNLRTHPDAESRIRTLAQAAAATGDATARVPTPISFDDEIAERDGAWAAGSWRDDPNFAIEYAHQSYADLTGRPPAQAWLAAHRRAIAALERVPRDRRPEPLLRNLMIYYAFTGEQPQATHNAAVNWLNGGGQRYPGAVALLIMLGQDNLARQLVSFQCRDHQEANRGNRDALPCRTFDNHKNELTVAIQWGTKAEIRVLRHLANQS
jgi:hypothetical protein